MLEELLKKESIDIKKKKLEDNFGLMMNLETERRVNLMCNLSDNVFEDGIEAGLEKGRAEGRAEERIELIKNLMQSMNIDAEAAMNALKIPKEEQDKYKKILK